MRRIDKVVAAAMLAATLAGCASGRRIGSAPALAKAKGTITFKKMTDRGTRIILKVKGLADPESLNPPGYAYVAWVQSDREAPPENVGALSIEDDQRGELRTATTLRDFELFVTAEPASDVTKPAGPPLLWAHRDARIKLVHHDEWTQLALSEAP